jgi:IS30 family transposase
MTYSQLSSEERDLIFLYLRRGVRPADIARLLDRHPSTISRELKRNGSPLLGYLPDRAQSRYQQRRKACRPKLRLSDPDRQQVVLEGLSNGWSPEVIVGRWRLEHGTRLACPETLYQFIYESPIGRQGRLYEWLKQAHPRRRKYPGRRVRSCPLGPRRFITERPVEANERRAPGHWETDTAHYKGPHALNVLADRYSRYVVLTHLLNHTAAETTRALVSRLAVLPVATLTADNGSEFAHHEHIAQTLRLGFYFCPPYRAWEKGTVENTIGRIRRYLPRNMNLSRVTQEELDDIAEELNNTPRRCLAFRTPNEVLSQCRCT